MIVSTGPSGSRKSSTCCCDGLRACAISGSSRCGVDALGNAAGRMPARATAVSALPSASCQYSARVKSGLRYGNQPRFEPIQSAITVSSGNDPCKHCEIAQVCHLRNLLRRGLHSHRVTAERDGGFLAGGAHPGHLPLSGHNSGLAMVSGHGMPQIAEVARAPLPQHGVKQRFETEPIAQGRAELVVTNVDKRLVVAKRLGRPRGFALRLESGRELPDIVERDQRHEKAARVVGRGRKQLGHRLQLAGVATKQHLCHRCHVETMKGDWMRHRLAVPHLWGGFAPEAYVWWQT